MWKSYSSIIWNFLRITLSQERRLITQAQKGSKESKDELTLRHIGFLIFRIRKKVFPSLIQRFAEDLLEEAILVVYEKIESYNLNYRDKQGNPRPVKFISYIWKRIDGFIIDSLKKETLLDRKFISYRDGDAVNNRVANRNHSGFEVIKYDS